MDQEIIICDFDGTLSDATHRKYLIEGQHRDFDEFNKQAKYDPPRERICEIVKELSKDRPILILSGRSEAVRDEAENWLKDNGIEYTWMILRKEKDYRDAVKYKSEELLEFLTKNNYTLSNIYCAFDDEDRIIELFNKLNITTFKV